MAAPPEINITASKRVPFDDTIPDTTADYTNATLAMEARAEPGDSGSALISLAMSVAGGEGLSVEYDAGYIDDTTGQAIGASIVRIRINESTLEGLSLGADTASDVTLYYDIHLTPDGGKKFVFCAGKLIITPGVTI